ncbi:DUF4124 domain-containing protein [Pseudomonas nitroreducens]|uniref:DUF4124 domain-containing protein n=1 Tax=Pseudomonas nitroreducens TaxID=46680 RepID=UPI003F5A9D15|nr:hypothetical protein [Pseudomonas nitroreducens]MCP1690043.1 hypothetical protein [Pseudomonas nitroreducens]
MAKQGAYRYRVLMGLLGAMLAGQAAADQAASQVEMYRYVNDKGITVIDRLGVPPQYIGKGYQVLNEQGRVIREVPPAPTAAEIEQRKADAARASSDQQLMRMYTSVEDVDRARDRKLAELDGLTSVAKGNLQSLKMQQANLQARAADQERAGRQVPDDLVAQLNNLRSDEQRLQQDIARYQQLRVQAVSSFGEDRARVAQLVGN